MQTHPPQHTTRTRRPLRRSIGRAVLAVGLIAVLAACEPTLTTRPAHQNAADAAASWIAADHQTNGAGHTAGALADTVLALAVLGDQKPTAEAALASLEAKAPAYVAPGGNVNSGAAAKVMLAVQAMRGQVNDFAGLDLEQLLRDSIGTSGTNTGRIGNATGFTQPLGILALSRTRAGAPVETGRWLVDQQCPDGGFSSGSCLFESPDATALALTALSGSAEFDGRTDAVVAALGYLVDRQLPDGGWGAGNQDTASNTNSTGLVAQALRVWAPDKADAGAEFVKSLQYPTGSGAKTGAIRWSASSDGALAMSTTQAVLAFGSTTYREVVFPKVVGQACEGTEGVTVVVDLALFDGTIHQRCAEGPQDSGWAALENAGYRVDSVPGFPGSAICTIETFPSEGYPACWYEGFWSYFHSEFNDGEWAFSNWGASQRTPPMGSVDGWRYEPNLATHIAAAPGIPAPTH